MSAKLPRKKTESVACALLLASFLAGSSCFQFIPASASDWVEEGVTEFHLPEHRRADDIEPARQVSPRKPAEKQEPSEFYDSSYARPSAQEEDKAPPKEQHHASPAHSGQEFTPPSDAIIKNVTDEGGVELGKNLRPAHTRAPLEAGISTWQKQNADYGTPGVDRNAARLLATAPMLAPPKIVSANPKAFRAWLNETHPGLAEKLTKDQLIEVKGAWDDSSHVLRTFGVPFTRVTTKQLSSVNFDKAKFVVVSCAGDLPADALLSLRRFVAMGGYLLTTDWALSGVIQKAFPGVVEWNGGYTEGKIVDAVPVDPDKTLFANTPPIAHWQLCKKSQMVKISKVNPDTDIRVLVRSRLLMRDDPSNLGILAFTFMYGNGHVLHLVGHFDNNSEMAFNTALPDAAPGIDVSLRQAIAVNFLSQAVQQGSETTAAKNEESE